MGQGWGGVGREAHKGLELAGILANVYTHGAKRQAATDSQLATFFLWFPTFDCSITPF